MFVYKIIEKANQYRNNAISKVIKNERKTAPISIKQLNENLFVSVDATTPLFRAV